MRSQLSVISDINWLLMTDAQSNLVDIPPLLLIMPKQNASSRAVLYSIALVIMKKSRRRGGVMNASPPPNPSPTRIWTGRAGSSWRCRHWGCPGRRRRWWCMYRTGRFSRNSVYRGIPAYVDILCMNKTSTTNTTSRGKGRGLMK